MAMERRGILLGVRQRDIEIKISRIMVYFLVDGHIYSYVVPVLVNDCV